MYIAEIMAERSRVFLGFFTPAIEHALGKDKEMQPTSNPPRTVSINQALRESDFMVLPLANPGSVKEDWDLSGKFAVIPVREGKPRPHLGFIRDGVEGEELPSPEVLVRELQEITGEPTNVFVTVNISMEEEIYYAQVTGNVSMEDLG